MLEDFTEMRTTREVPVEKMWKMVPVARREMALGG